jgi:hypothetical protein
MYSVEEHNEYLRNAAFALKATVMFYLAAGYLAPPIARYVHLGYINSGTT